MATQPYSPREVRDAFLTFEAGVNHGVAPELVPRNQLADGLNVSVRGDFVKSRSYLQKRNLSFLDSAIRSVLNGAWIQGACIYKPDFGNECIMVSASGRLYQFEIFPTQAIVTDVTGTEPQLANATLCWLWQAEKWVIWNDGKSNPVFYEKGVGTTRSNYGAALKYSTYNTASFVVPGPGQTVNVTLNSVANLVVGDIVTFQNRGQMSVADLPGGTIATFLNINASPTGWTVGVHTALNANVSWQHTGTQLPPGRMGAYGMSRIWMSLVDGKQFIASDVMGGSSGTQANNYRDAILEITENFYLAGGGAFAVPGTIGEIVAMRFAATLDASLGQGPLQVFTRHGVFSCQTPVDRLTWQDVTNPILTQSLLGGGATGQDSTVNANGDILMRSIEGIRSLILARREFDTWGNTPISREVDPIFAQDSQDLLPWASAVVFDNRCLVTVKTVLGAHGPYFMGLVPLNFDPVSGLRGKQPSVYDSRAWTGLNAYKVLTDTFQNVQRCFALSFNVDLDELELYELLPEESPYIADNGITRVAFQIETGTKDFGVSDFSRRELLRLVSGELAVEDLQGTVDFYVWFKPDQWPGWVPWAHWQECATIGADGKPQFRPRMGLPEPSAQWCDPILNRPLNLFYTCRVKIQIVGHCTLKGGRLIAVTTPEPSRPPPICSAICPS